MTHAVLRDHDVLDDLVNEVCEEYAAAGLLTKALWDTPVVTTATDLLYPCVEGFWVPEDGLLYERNTIYLPRAALTTAGWARLRGERLNVRDVLRHEYAHALAYGRGDEELVLGNGRFRRAFGAEHEDEDRPTPPRRDCVSEYARTDACEDFAETVTHYLRYRAHERGLGRWARRPALLRKMEFVASLPGRIRRLGLRLA